MSIYLTVAVGWALVCFARITSTPNLTKGLDAQGAEWGYPLFGFMCALVGAAGAGALWPLVIPYFIALRIAEWRGRS